MQHCLGTKVGGLLRTGLLTAAAALAHDALPVSAADPVVLDLGASAQPFLGLGAQVWAGNRGGLDAVEQIGGRFVRAHHGTNFFSFDDQPPADDNGVVGDNFAAMKSYIAANFNGPSGSEPWHLPNITGMQAWATSNQVEIILNEFQIADSFLNSQGIAMPSNRVDDFATFWGAMVSYLDDQGVRPKYVELANEPNGTWNGRISGPNYNTLVKQTRALLDEHGYGNVGILGPGLNYLGNTVWIDALDQDGVDSLAGWSSHTWDDYLGIDDRAQIFRDAVRARDPSKPIFITEYATDKHVFGGTTYGDPDAGGDAADRPEFAVEVLNNTLALVNNGASSLLYWEGADQPWNTIRWGLRRVNGGSRPVARALAFLTEQLPEDAVVVEPPADDGPLTVSGFLGGDRFVLAATNTTENEVTTTIQLDGWAGGIDFDRGQQYHNDAVTALVSTLVGKELTITLPPTSAQVFSFDLLAAPGDHNGDGTIDLLDYNLWESTYGSTTQLAADGNEDGVVDAADYTLWRTAYDELQATAVPEASAYSCAAWLIAAAIGTRRKQ